MSGKDLVSLSEGVVDLSAVPVEQVIEYLHMTEADAHRYITRQAMEQRTGKREIAESVIRTYQ